MARIKKHLAEEDNAERWMVSYADFITLLFAFFTILYATSESNQEKMKKFEQSVKKHLIAFGVAGQGGGAASLSQEKSNDTSIENPLRQFKRGDTSGGQETMGRVETYVVSQLSESQIETYIKDIDLASVGVRLSLSAVEVFSGTSARIRPGATQVLDKIGRLLKQQNRKVWVEGHMDGANADPKAWSISANRAQTIARYLIKVHKLPANLVAAVSYGGERPLFPNDSAQNRQKNQRVDFLILTQDAPI